MKDDITKLNKKDSRLGWIPDLPDHRDKLMSARMKVDPSTLPPSVDLSTAFPEVYDQGNLGSCTAQAIAAALDFCHQRKEGTRFFPSRLFIYYNERVVIDTVNEDSGASLRDGIKSVNTIGACREELWKHHIPNFKKKPTVDCYVEALNYQAVDYNKLIHTDLNQLKQCLANSFPFVFGVTLYSSFMDNGNGIIPFPSLGEEMQGGHAMICVGYDDARNSFLVRNSWGEKWGLGGYCYIPYPYMTHRELAGDFWCITSAE